MLNLFNLYVSKKSKDFFNRLVSIAEVTNVSTSSLIMKSVKMYIDKMDNVQQLFSNPEFWDDIIDNMSRKELEDTNTLLFRLNKKIIECHANTNK